MSTSTEDARSRSQQSPLASQRAGQPAPQKVQEGPRAGSWFTLGYKDAASQWWTSLSPAVTEHKVLSFIPYLQKPPTHTETGSAPASCTNSRSSSKTRQAASSVGSDVESVTTTSITDPWGPRRWNSQMVPLEGKDRALNEFSVERVGEDVEQNLVMIHGYGAGLGFFYKNFDALTRVPGWKLYALDLLGMGRSSRPPFKIHAKDREGKINEAENWFIDALEEWRIKRKIDRFTLVGHSLGGYMAVAYALKYPGHLNKLVLASPVGIPEDPYAVSAELPEPEDSAMINEFTQDQDETTAPSTTKVGDNNNFLNARSKAAATKTPDQPQRKPLPKWLTYLWDANISPFSLVRWAGPLGPRFVSGWTSRRFSHLPPEEAQALHDYSYSLFRQRGSGEYALAYILAPGAFARSPLIRRIQGVGRQFLQAHADPIPDSATASNPANPSVKRENGIPIILMYGEHDWMDVAGGFAAEEKIKEQKKAILAQASEEEKEQDSGSAKVVILRQAGHHVYLDGAEEFNDIMVKEMKDVSKRESARR